MIDLARQQGRSGRVAFPDVVKVRGADPARGKARQMRRIGFASKRRSIAPPQIIGENNNQIGPARMRGSNAADPFESTGGKAG